MKVLFPTTLDVRFHHDADGVRWELLSSFVVIVNPQEEGQRIIRVAAGYITDFASVPRLPFVYFAYANKAHLAALVHDWLYTEGGSETDREYADTVFLQGILDSLIPEDSNSLTNDDAYALYNAVRQFGRSHFHYHEDSP